MWLVVRGGKILYSPRIRSQSFSVPLDCELLFFFLFPLDGTGWLEWAETGCCPSLISLGSEKNTSRLGSGQLVSPELMNE